MRHQTNARSPLVSKIQPKRTVPSAISHHTAPAPLLEVLGLWLRDHALHLRARVRVDVEQLVDPLEDDEEGRGLAHVFRVRDEAVAAR